MIVFVIGLSICMIPEKSLKAEEIRFSSKNADVILTW
jgi:hypothetical protein